MNESTNFFKSTSAKLLGLLAGAALIFAMYSGMNNSDNATADNKSPNSETTVSNGLDKASFTKLEIDPPVKEVDVDPNSFVVKDHQKANTFTMPSGTKVSIPQNTFVDKNGNPVTTDVKIELQEYNTASEIITSGIPMTVYKDGKEEWMQTAGMFQIKGFQGNEEVEIAESKEIEVSYASQVDGEYPSWYFDEEVGNWNEIGSTDGSNVQQISNPNLAKEVKALEQKTATKPQAPNLDESERYEFTDLDVSGIAELKGLNSVILIYDDADDKLAPSKNKWISTPGIWLKKELKPLGEPRKYQLTMYGDRKYSVPVRLPLQADEIKKAKANFAAALAEYNKNIALLKEKREFAKQERFMRNLFVSRFGVYNCDVLARMGNIISLDAEFEFEGIDENDLPEEGVTIYLVTGEERMVLTYKENNWDNFRLSLNADNKMVAILPMGKAAIFTASDFENQKEKMADAKGNDYTFSMDVLDKTIEDDDDISELLDMANDSKATINKVFPNPFNNSFTVDYETVNDTEIEIMVTDISGRRVYNANQELSAGQHDLQVNIDDNQLTNGSYMLRIVDKDGNLQTRQLIRTAAN